MIGRAQAHILDAAINNKVNVDELKYIREIEFENTNDYD
jgi:hypothetical protein